MKLGTGIVAGMAALLLVGAQPALAQNCNLTTVDTQQTGQGPKDLLAVRRGGRTFVLGANHGDDTVQRYSLNRNGDLALLGQAGVGDGLVASHDRRFALVTNLLSQDVSVLSLSNRGNIREVSRTPTGGLAPEGVAISRGGFAVTANAFSDDVSVFHLNRNGDLALLGREPAGITPLSVDISQHGVVAVANYNLSDLTVYQLNRNGDLALIQNSVPVGFQAHGVTFGRWGRALFVGSSSQQADQQDSIHGFRVNFDGTLHHRSTTPAGYGLDDLTLSGNPVTVATQDQVIQFRRRGLTGLRKECEGTFNQGATLKSIATARQRWWGSPRFTLVHEFQTNTLRVLLQEQR